MCLQDLQCYPLNEDEEPDREKCLAQTWAYFISILLWAEQGTGNSFTLVLNVEGMSLILKAAGFSQQDGM